MSMIRDFQLDFLEFIGGGLRIYSLPGVGERLAGQRLNLRR